MMSTLEPNMVIDVQGAVSGQDVVDDLCTRIAERLSADCNMRGSDSYQSYSARVRVELWLQDYATVEVNADLDIGFPPSTPPPQTLTMAVAASADQIAPLPNLERPVDEAGTTEALAPRQKRYVPTGKPRGRPRK